MKKIIVTAVIALFSFSGIAQEQDRQSVENRIQKRVDMITQQLDLTETQQQQLYKLYKDELDDRKATSSTAQVKVNRKQQIDQRRNAYDKRLKSILTDEQYKKLKQSKQKKTTPKQSTETKYR